MRKTKKKMVQVQNHYPRLRRLSSQAQCSPCLWKQVWLEIAISVDVLCHHDTWEWVQRSLHVPQSREDSHFCTRLAQVTLKPGPCNSRKLQADLSFLSPAGRQLLPPDLQSPRAVQPQQGHRAGRLTDVRQVASDSTQPPGVLLFAGQPFIFFPSHRSCFLCIAVISHASLLDSWQRWGGADSSLILCWCEKLTQITCGE